MRIQRFNEARFLPGEVSSSHDIHDIFQDLKDNGYKISLHTKWVTDGYSFIKSNPKEKISLTQFRGSFYTISISAKGRFDISKFESLTNHILDAQTCVSRMEDLGGRVEYVPYIGKHDDDYYNENDDEDENGNHRQPRDPSLTTILFQFHLITNVKASRDATIELLELIKPFIDKNKFINVTTDNTISRSVATEIRLKVLDPVKKEDVKMVMVAGIRRGIGGEASKKNEKVEEFRKKASEIYSEIEKIVQENNLKSDKKIILPPWSVGCALPLHGLIRLLPKLPQDKSQN